MPRAPMLHRVFPLDPEPQPSTWTRARRASSLLLAALLAGLPGATGTLLAPAGEAAEAMAPLIAYLPAGTVLEELPPEAERNGVLWNEFIGPGAQLAISLDGRARSAVPFVTEPQASAAQTRPEPAIPDYPKDLGAPALCTANWVFKDQSGDLYLGTAGHCVLPGTHASTHGGAPFDASAVRVYVCRSLCPLGGAAGTVHANAAAAGPASDWVELGNVTYARQWPDGNPNGGVGNDFALIEIPDGLHGSVSPALAGWGGPAGEAAGARIGDLALLHGNGLFAAETFATKSRAGEITSVGAKAWQAELFGNGGDSGGAVGHLAVDPAQPDPRVRALGLLTHGPPATHVLGWRVPEHGWFSGTTLGRALEMAEADAGLCLRLVLQGEDPAAAQSGSC